MTLFGNLGLIEADIQMVQELLRYASDRITLDLNSEAVSSQRREASAKVVEMLAPAAKKPQHHRVPTEKQKEMVLSVGC